MIELLFLFLIVISIVLCTFALSYKCTDGSMSMSDFKLNNCYMLSRESENIPETKEKEDIPNTPLMGDNTFNFVKGEEDDDDYSKYIDYFDLNRKAVRYDPDPAPIPDPKNHPDYKDVYADGPGHCAKICYDKEEDILNKTCNAFQSDGGRKCRLFWSVSEFADGRSSGDEIAFRLKTPRDEESHERREELNLENTSTVYAYSECNYNGVKTPCPMNDYTSEHFGGNIIKSVIVPSGMFAELFTGTDFSGVSVVLYESNRCIVGDFRSARIGEIDGDVLRYYSPPEE